MFNAHRYLIFTLLLISFAAPLAAPAQTLLARDDLREWTGAALREYLTQEGDSYLENLMAAASDPSSPFRPLLQQQIEQLSFRHAFVAQHQSQPLSPESQWALKRQMWNWAEQKLNQEVEKNIDLSTPTLLQAYKQHLDRFNVEERRQMAVLFKAFPSGAEREAIIQQMNEWRAQPDINDNFLEYVKQHSDLPGASLNPIVPFFKRGTYGPTVEQHAFSTPKGQLSPVFTATSGAYILKILDAIPEGHAPFSEVRGLVATIAKEQQRATVRDTILAPLRQQAATLTVQAPSLTAPPDTSVLHVNDYRLTWGILKANEPELAQLIEAAPASAQAELSDLAGVELYLQHLERTAKRNPAAPESLALDIYRIRTEFRIRLIAHLDSKITIQEDELKAHYDQIKEFYHGPAPRKFRVLEALYPNRSQLSSPLYSGKIEQIRRDMIAIHKELTANPDEFAARAQQWAAAHPYARVYQTELIPEFPEGWLIRKPITSFGLGMVSGVEATDRSLVIFQVAEVGQPEILPFDQVRDKVYRVIRGGKEDTIIKSLREDTLKKINFQILLKDHSSPKIKRPE
jgi:hypothetical protein